jgi:hypothetical protein
MILRAGELRLSLDNDTKAGTSQFSPPNGYLLTTIRQYDEVTAH